ncbi:MATE family efflux transporter [Heyndrickxia sporothermodurans]|uniref:MATE family efflux transporter n=1 Tax=Heyndrickxia sporothermodurans TaxID=46224 RepID=UPI002E1B5F7B|nr:MATE family efflux transporter [Heyndrickxia sporothermodurans]MED3652626.1 MATE family efflux transporter [Heyndrickxia sporothermodurans]MED3696812.1 MATE family efflux transporter [Heyndrickxia sporothermodurans]
MTKTNRKAGNYWEILSVSLPILAGSITSMLVGAIDTAMMGRFSVDGLAGVAAAAAVFNIFANIIQGSLTGHQVLSSRRFGAGTPDQVGVSFRHSLLFSGGVALVSVIILLVTSDWLLLLLTESRGVLESGTSYMYARSLELLIMVPAMMIQSTFNAEKQTKWSMYTMILVASTTVIFNYPLIHGLGVIPALGATGSGLASVLARTVGLLFLITVAYKKSLFKRIRPHKFRFQAKEFTQVRNISMPAIFSGAFDYVANTLFFIIMGMLGSAYLAGGRIAFNLIMIFFSIAMSLAMGCQILVGRSWGARNLSMIQDYVSRSRLLLTVILSLLAIPLIVWPQGVASIFTSFIEVQEATLGAIRIIGICAPILALACTNVSALRGMGKTSGICIPTCCLDTCSGCLLLGYLELLLDGS